MVVLYTAVWFLFHVGGKYYIADQRGVHNVLENDREAGDPSKIIHIHRLKINLYMIPNMCIYYWYIYLVYIIYTQTDDQRFWRGARAPGKIFDTVKSKLGQFYFIFLSYSYFKKKKKFFSITQFFLLIYKLNWYLNCSFI